MMKSLYKLFLSGLLLVAFFYTYSQQSVFINYSLEDGIPQSTVLSLYQDLNRNLWIGTQGGICKYNGQVFETFDTRHGLTDNHIASIFQDSKGRLWIGHRYKGATLMQGKNFQKVHFTNTRINSIKEDLAGNIWFGTLDSSLYVLPSGKVEKVENFIQIQPTKQHYFESIYDIMVVDSGIIWLATENGIMTLNYSADGNFSYKLSSPENEFLSMSVFYSMLKAPDSSYWLLGDDILVNMSLSGDGPFELSQYPFDRKVGLNYIKNIAIDKSGIIWGAIDQGVFKFENGIFEYIDESDGLVDPEINTVINDVEGNIWIGSTNSGVYKYSGEKFKIYNKESGLRNEIVTAVLEDTEENVWIGTQKGVYVIIEESVYPFKLPHGYENIEISSIYEDSKGNIWFGSYSKHDLIRYNPDFGKFWIFNKSDGMITSSVITICEDDNDCIWFATLGIGLSKYTYPSYGSPGKFETYTEEDGLGSVLIWTIHKDNEGNLWFGSDNAGITKYDGTRFEIFDSEDGLDNLSVGAIAHDSKNQIWIASIGGGIYKFDGEKFVNYNIQHGLNSDNPYSIISDNNDQIWIGTNSGIDRFDPIEETFKHYGKEEGFLGIENNQNAVSKGKDGTLWFGTVNGLEKFNPEKIKQNLIPPKTTIEDIKLFYTEFDYSEYADSLDKNNLPVHLKLPFNKNHLSFDFCGVSLSVPGKVNYQYKLENFDPEWNPVTKSSVATYTNIPPGAYTFMVKASNNDGIWNEKPTQINIEILAPFWQKWWFITLIVLSVFGLIYLIFYGRIKSIKVYRAKLESLVEEKTKELLIEVDERKKATIKAEQSDRLKTAFLANMSHEIRTPVNAITGFTELLHDKDLTKEEREVYLEYIKSGGKALLTLIDDIIDISKIEAGQLVVRHEDCSVNTLMSDLYKLFQQIKVKRDKADIDLRLADDLISNELIINTDANRLKQILSNLLGNAIKFTHKGFVEFGYKLDKPGQIVFYVKDTGIGIAEDKQEIIFQRFRQVEETFTKNYEGTGLGLAISKKLANLLGGKMWVESTLGKGSVFYLSIPLKIVRIDVEPDLNNGKPVNEKHLQGRNILVVEDEDSNFILTETILKAFKVNVLRAEDGLAAVDLIRRNGQQIDLILMDIKMPLMNGYEATAEIKKIKHKIPIIAQTAYVLAEEKEKCLEAGCDDYIAKPIDRQLLLEKINKFLNN